MIVLIAFECVWRCGVVLPLVRVGRWVGDGCQIIITWRVIIMKSDPPCAIPNAYVHVAIHIIHTVGRRLSRTCSRHKL